VQVVKISGLSLTRQAGDMKILLQRSLTNLLTLSDYRLLLEDAALDIGTPFGDLRFVAGITIDPPEKDGHKKINAHITADQYQLGFDSKWTGQIDENGNLDMDADFNDGRLHFGPMNVMRFSGWVGLKAGKDNYALQTQLNAGGADLFKIPLHDLSLVTDANLTDSTLMFRSSMAGMNDVMLTADMTMNKTAQSLDILLKGSNLSNFLGKVAEQRGGMTVPASLKRDQDFKLLCSYQPDRRFASGPLPFSLTMTSGGDKMLTGNFLIYPDVMDIRGSAETKADIAKALQSFLGLDPKNVDGNIIRLDGSLEKMVKPGSLPLPAAPSTSQE